MWTGIIEFKIYNNFCSSWHYFQWTLSLNLYLIIFFYLLESVQKPLDVLIVFSNMLSWSSYRAHKWEHHYYCQLSSFWKPLLTISLSDTLEKISSSKDGFKRQLEGGKDSQQLILLSYIQFIFNYYRKYLCKVASDSKIVCKIAIARSSAALDKLYIYIIFIFPILYASISPAALSLCNGQASQMMKISRILMTIMWPNISHLVRGNYRQYSNKYYVPWKYLVVKANAKWSYIPEILQV